MADDGDESGGSFLFCNVCRVHHQQGKKHKYSSKHKNLCRDIINKYKCKTKQCLEYLHKPEVIDGELEPGANFWCQFCQKRVTKHVTDRTISIKYGGLFEHLSSVEHHKKTHLYWRVNGIDRTEKDHFLITSDTYTNYKNKCQESLEQWKHQLETADEIKQTEIHRTEMLAHQHQSIRERIFEAKTVNNSHGVLQNSTGWHNGVRVWKGGIVRTRPKQTLSRVQGRQNDRKTHAEVDELKPNHNLPSLSCVARTWRSSSKGNVHTGAPPPWLQNDDNDLNSTSDSIGPSFEDFKKHVDKQKKSKANPKRVGANFDRTVKKDDKWLPSFGGVWNAGPRWHSRREYKSKKTTTRRSTATEQSILHTNI
eukprot:gene10897-12056_t